MIKKDHVINGHVSLFLTFTYFDGCFHLILLSYFLEIFSLILSSDLNPDFEIIHFCFRIFKRYWIGLSLISRFEKAE